MLDRLQVTGYGLQGKGSYKLITWNQQILKKIKNAYLRI